MPKYVIKHPLQYKKKIYQPGEEIELPEAKAAYFVSSGIIVSATKKVTEIISELTTPKTDDKDKSKKGKEKTETLPPAEGDQIPGK